MKIIKTIPEWSHYRDTLNSDVGFIPTMGALHPGHLSLVDKSVEKHTNSVVSIFVNPTQFNSASDLKNYPHSLADDLQLLEKHNVSAVFTPSFDQIYPDNYTFKTVENNFSYKLCGTNRPGHFDGVLTVVMKLLNLVKPSVAYFGEKDFQQLSLIKAMVAAYFMPVKIVGLPTVREEDGLAMSSRNSLLTVKERQLAPLMHKWLTSNNSLEVIKQELTKVGFDIDYIEDVNNRRYAAAILGNVRLIDNVKK